MENSRVDTYTVSHWNEATCVRERSILTAEQEFTFDALGFVVLSQVLSLDEMSACRHSSTTSSDTGVSRVAAVVKPTEASDFLRFFCRYRLRRFRRVCAFNPAYLF